MKISNFLRTRILKPALARTSPADRRVEVGAIAHTIEQALGAAGLGAQANRRNMGRPLHGVDDPRCRPEQACPGTFINRSYTNSAGTRAYKIYIPTSYSDTHAEAVPMLVMLHGCTQSPDDFATGTGMNALAEQHGFLVVYPAQTAGANGSKCWNWFRAEDQHRDQGEPWLIAGITRDVASDFRVDERRIFVAGLSAGAAMAVILGTTYPDLYAAVGAHSGLPYGAAYDVPTAFGAMKAGASGAGLQAFAATTVRPSRGSHGVPTIVFHGDRDRTVHPANSNAITEHATLRRAGEPNLHATDYRDADCSRTVYADATNRPVVEHWVLHGVGHAWSGGSPSGSFTDAGGPDASAEMIRFFYAQQGTGSVAIA